MSETTLSKLEQFNAGTKFVCTTSSNPNATYHYDAAASHIKDSAGNPVAAIGETNQNYVVGSAEVLGQRVRIRLSFFDIKFL